MDGKDPFGALIIHGLSAALNCVAGVEEAIRELGLPTRMPVLRGHGADSPEALRDIRWPDWVADGEAALDDLLTEVNQAILFGHSMGGLVALHLAADRTDEIDSLVLAAAAIQLTSPVAPGRPLSFLLPLVERLLDTYDMPPVYVDEDQAKTDATYDWLPIEAVSSFLTFSKVTRSRLPEITVPTLIMQSRADTTVAPESAEIIYRHIATPKPQKRIVWFEKTEHEMFRDIERQAAIQTVADFVKGRVG